MIAEEQLPWETATASFCSTATFAPISAAFTAAMTPEAPAPATTTSTSTSFVKSVMGSRITAEAFTSSAVMSLRMKAPLDSTMGLTEPEVTVSPLAWAMQFFSAVLTAVLVMVAPETPSISTPWVARICSTSASWAAWPMLSVSPETSSTTSVMESASKVQVRVTVPMPTAEAE